MADTTTLGYPYPEATDVNNVAGDILALAQAVNAAPGIKAYNQTQIDALTVAQKPAGLVVYNSTTSTLQQSNGSVFADIAMTAAVTSALAGKAPATGIATSAVTGLDTALAGKAPSTGIALSAVTSLVTSLASKAGLGGATFTGEVDVVSATATGSTSVRQITISTGDPSGGADGDVWIKYV